MCAIVAKAGQPPVRPSHKCAELQIAVAEYRLAEEFKIEAECVLHVQHAVSRLHDLDDEGIGARLPVSRRIVHPDFVLHPTRLVMGDGKGSGARLLILVECGVRLRLLRPSRHSSMVVVCPVMPNPASVTRISVSHPATTRGG